MSVLGTNKDRGAAAVAPVMQAPADKTGFFQNVGAGFREAVAGPHSTRNGEAIYQYRAYQQIIQALQAEGEQGVDYVRSPVSATSPFYHHVDGEKINANGVVYVPVSRAFRNPFVSGPSLTAQINPIEGLYLGGDKGEKEQIWAAVQKVRQRKPDFLKAFPDEGALDQWTAAERQKDLATASEVTDRAGTLGKVGAFTGGAAGSVASGDPENFVGGGFGTAASRTVARTIIRRAAEGAAVNTGVGIAATPGQIMDAQSLGQEMTREDVLHNVGQTAIAGAVLGGGHALVPHAAEAGGKMLGKIGGKIAENLPAPVRNPVITASIRAGTVKDRGLLYEWQKLHNPYGAVDTSTPDERAAAHVITRDVENQEASPLQPQAVAQNHARMSALGQALAADLPPPDLPSAAPVQKPTVRDQSSAAPASRRVASFSEGIGAAEGSTRNPRSSADGYGNFIDSTWLSVAPHVTDTAGMGREQILALRHDKSIAKQAIDYYAAQNASYLRSRGLEDSPGNLSLAHFLGPEGAAALLKAEPSTPVERLLPTKVIRANHEVLQGKSADQVIAWAHKRIGAAVEHPPARPDAVADEDFDYSSPVPYTVEMLKPDDVTTNAALMQYKSGGDDAGVTDALKGVEQWNPLLSQQIMVWEPREGGRIVVDGHQRVGLAQRLFGSDENIRLPSIIIREADGITAQQARVLGALRNIANGTGTLLDNARVLRDAPEGAVMLPNNAAQARDSIGLSRLSYEAFGAVLNDVLDPRIAAQIGLHAGHRPEAHMALAELLRKERIHDPKEAAAITRQALADGFGTADAEQLSLLGDEPQQSLYVPIARIMDAAAKRLRQEKRTFKTLSENAVKIEAEGNVLDRAANESKVVGNDEALAILERTAHTRGPVRDALIAAARAELSGARRADAVNQFIDALGDIDLRSAARGVEPDGELRGAPLSERLGLADSEADRDLFDRSEPSRDQLEKFSDPVGEATRAQTANLEHDLLMDAGLHDGGEHAKSSDMPKSVKSIPNADAYIKAINPSGKRVLDHERPNLGMGDMYGMAPKGAKEVLSRDVDGLGLVRFVQDGDNFYALAHNPDLGEEDVIGYAMDRGDGTELHVVAEAQGKGVGSELSYLYRSHRPLAPSGGLTAAGESAARKAFERMTGGREQGPHLFDIPDTGFRTSEEGDKPQSIAEIMARAEADEQAARDLKACLQPHGPAE